MRFSELVHSGSEVRAVSRGKGQSLVRAGVLRGHLIAWKQKLFLKGVLEVVTSHGLGSKSLNERHVILKGHSRLHERAILFLKTGSVASDKRVLITYIDSVGGHRPGGRSGREGVEDYVLIAVLRAAVIQRGRRITRTCAHAILMAILDTSGHVQLQRKVVGEVNVDIRTEVIALEPHIVDDAVLVEIASAHEIANGLRASAYAEVMVLSISHFLEDKVEVVSVPEDALRVVSITDIAYLLLGVLAHKPV